MHTVKDYTNSPTKNFDAVEDVKEWLGKRKWSEVSPQMASFKDINQFEFLAGIAGIKGFPVEAWYDLYHGGGAYRKLADARGREEDLERDYLQPGAIIQYPDTGE